MHFQLSSTVHRENKRNLIDPNKSQTILMQAMRGAGKSNFLEYAGEQLYYNGWTGLDIWAAPNGENWFYPINMNCKDEYLKIVSQDSSKRGMLHCNCHKTHPIMIICPETKRFDQHSLDVFNGLVIKSREWWVEYANRHNIFPIEFRKEMVGKKIEASQDPLVTIKYLPEPAHNGSNYDRFRKLVIDAILECRNQGRYLTFNPILWENEFAKFKAVDLLVRLLEHVKYTYFTPKEEEVIGPIWKKIEDGKRVTIQELRMLNWDKMFVIAREFGELTASNLRAEESSTITKRAFLSFIRRSRHAQITLLGDYQNPDDVFSSIRDQADIFLIKRAPKRLFGQGWNWLFDNIENKREQIFQKYGRTKYAFDLADARYPRIEQLANNYLYAIYPDDSYVLWKIPTPDFHHKRADENFRVITGITWEDIDDKSNKTTIDPLASEPKETRTTISMVQIIHSLVTSRTEGGKEMTYKEAFDEIMKMAGQGKISRPSWNSPNSMLQWYKRNQKSSEPEVL